MTRTGVFLGEEAWADEQAIFLVGRYMQFLGTKDNYELLKHLSYELWMKIYERVSVFELDAVLIV